MKKMAYLFAFLMLASVTVFTSCNKDDDDDEPANLKPSISFKGGNGYTSGDVTIETGESIKFGITATANTTSDKKLTNLKVDIIQNNTPSNLLDSTFNEKYFDADYNLVLESAGNAKLQATVTDKDGQSKSIEFNLTVNEPQVGVQVHKYVDIELGSHNDNEIGSFYATSDNMVYKIADAITNATTVDFAFFKGATNQNTIGSPADADVRDVFELNDTNWPNANETGFIKASSITVDDFNAIVDGGFYEFPEMAARPESKINNLVADEIIAFVTENDKMGLIKINETYSRGDRIKIDVVIAQ